MKRAEVFVRLRLAGIQRNGPLEVGLRFLEPVQPLEAKAARLVQGRDIWIDPVECVEALQGFGIPAETKQQLALFRGLQTLFRGLQILRRDLLGLLGGGAWHLMIHKLTRKKWTTSDGSPFLSRARRRASVALVPPVRQFTFSLCWRS